MKPNFVKPNFVNSSILSPSSRSPHLLSIAAVCVGVLLQVPAMAASKYGISVEPCEFDFDDEDFCSDSNMKQFAHIMNTRDANFVDDKILYIYQPATFSERIHDEAVYNMVVIDKTNKTAQPFYWSFSAAEQAVNNKGEHLQITVNQDEAMLCVKGNIYAYRNAYDFDSKYYPQGFCFPYVGDSDDATSAGFAWFETDY